MGGRYILVSSSYTAPGLFLLKQEDVEVLSQDFTS
jgi:hypothetical protein